MESFLSYQFISKSPVGDGTYVKLSYCKNGIPCEMEVNYYNGELCGHAAMVVVDGHTIGEAVFVHGGMTSFKEYSENKRTEYTFSDNIHNGSYIEYDGNDYVREKGSIEKDRRVVDIEMCSNKRGYYLLYEGGNTSVSAVASMDRMCERKNGKCYDIENGKVVAVSMYVNNSFRNSLKKEPVKDDNGRVLYPVQSIFDDISDALSDYHTPRTSYSDSSPSIGPAAGFAIAGGALAIGGAVAYWLAHRNKDYDSYR